MLSSSSALRRPSTSRWAWVIAVTAAICLAAAVWRLADQPQAVRLEGESFVRDTGEYAGVAACRPCHTAIVDAQLASSHAQTIRDISSGPSRAPFGNGQAVRDPLTGTDYLMEKGAGGRPQITLTQGDLKAGQALEYEFGSGRHAYGYVARMPDSTWLDARLNYYPRLKMWDFTSGQDKPQPYLTTQPLGRPRTPRDAARCFLCHSTVLKAHGIDKEPKDGSQLRLRPDKSVLGITCEGCHGPRMAHVRDIRAGRVSPASRPSADEINQMCGRCHGLTNVSDDHPVIARFQPWGLERSRCFRASAGRLSCMTCHDPHRNAEADPAFYEKKCLGCHSPARADTTVCPVNPRTGCVPCHMPADSKSMRHVTFADHRIRIVPPGERQTARAPAGARANVFTARHAGVFNRPR